MNWRYAVGSILTRASNAALSSPLFPLTRYVPPGKSWLYDIQRTNGTRRAGVIFDVGANIGQTAWDLVRYFPGARIYCFEPVRSTYDKLVANYGDHPSVTCVCSALGSLTEKRQMNLGRESGLNTFVSSFPERLTGQVEEVSITTVDQFCAANAIGEIDILKMDVQGWELEVLKGCSQNPKFVFAEVGFRSGEDDMQQFPAFHSHMESRGYLFGGLYDTFRYGNAKEFVLFANALYVRNT